MTRREEPARSVQQSEKHPGESGQPESLTDLIDVLRRQSFNRRFDPRGPALKTSGGGEGGTD